MGITALLLEDKRNKPAYITCYIAIQECQTATITIEHGGFDWDRESGTATLHHELPDGDLFKLAWASEDAE